MGIDLSGPGVIPGNGPGAGYVRKGWVMGLSIGLFVLALGLLALLYWIWPDCAAYTPASTTLTVTPSSQPPPPPPPTTKLQVTRISPRSGDPAGGTLVQIFGTGFAEPALVKFDKTPAVSTYVSPTAILATTPTHEEGEVDVSVQIGSNTSSVLQGGFTYKACAGQSSILLLVLLAGALGGTLHSIRSFYWYVGNRDLKWSWVPMYAFRPLTGAALACIFLLLVSGGVVNSQSPSNRLWIVGLAALIGLFSQQGFEKLKKIFEAIFTTVPQAADKPQTATTGSTSIVITPPTGPVSGGIPVKITGTGFLQGSTTVKFGTAQSEVQVESPTTLLAVLPAATQPGAVDVTVTALGGSTVILPKGFTYT